MERRCSSRCVVPLQAVAAHASSPAVVPAPAAAMTDMKKRSKAAILGGLVADAASMPLHVG